MKTKAYPTKIHLYKLQERKPNEKRQRGYNFVYNLSFHNVEKTGEYDSLSSQKTKSKLAMVRAQTYLISTISHNDSKTILGTGICEWLLNGPGSLSYRDSNINSSLFH